MSPQPQRRLDHIITAPAPDRSQGGVTHRHTHGGPWGSQAGMCIWGFIFTLMMVMKPSLAWPEEAKDTEPAKPAVASPEAVQDAASAPEPRAAKETPEQARRRELNGAHGPEIAEAILAGTVLKEMTMEQVVQARGEPTRKEVIPPDAELWHYPNGEVAFSGGKVTYVSLTAPIQPPPAAGKRQARQPGQSGRHSEQGEAERPVQVDAPPIRAGDTYVYESRDPSDPNAGVSTRRTVTSTRGTITLSSLNLDNKRARPRSLVFDRQWNLIATRSPDQSGKDYSPPLKYYDFPLFPGKTWEQTSTETDIKTGATRTHRISGTVGGWEQVAVPAGTFQAITVHLVTELFDPSTGERIQGTDTSWYVPEVRRSVKSETSGKDGRRGLIQLLHYELK